MTMSAGHEARTSAASGGGAITRRIAGDDEMAVGSGGSGGSGGSVSDAGGGDGGSGSAAGPSQAGGAGGAAMISSYVAVMSSQLVRLNRPSASRFRSESQSAESAALGVGRDGGGSSSRTSSPQSASSNMS